MTYAPLPEFPGAAPEAKVVAQMVMALERNIHMGQHLKEKHWCMAAASSAPSNSTSQLGSYTWINSVASAPRLQEASVTVTQKIETDDEMPPDSPIETIIESPAMQEEAQIQPEEPAAATGAFEAAATGVATGQRKFYYQDCRLRKHRDTLAAQLQRFTGAKLAAHNNQLSESEEWLLRVILAKPNASARAVEEMFADIVGSDVRTVSRGSINSVRDARVEP